jgi:hypothetical protein
MIERTQLNTSPLYRREGQAVPEDIDAARVIFIKREYVDPHQWIPVLNRMNQFHPKDGTHSAEKPPHKARVLHVSGCD